MKFICFILLFLIITCKDSSNKNFEKWDYLNSSFKNKSYQNHLTMIGRGYDVLGLGKINDSIFYLDLIVFKGWKKKSEVYNDTIKIFSNEKILDSFGNQKKQILKFKSKSNLNFELKITKSSTSDSINNYNFDGILQIDNKNFKYLKNSFIVK